MAFEYEAPDVATYQEEFEAQKEAEGSNEIPMLYLKKGITQVRILPPWPGSNQRWMRHVEEHVMQINGKWMTSTCGRAPEYSVPCAFCDLGERLHQEGINETDEEKTKRASNLKVRHSYLANVICHSSPDPEHAGLDKGIMVMKFGTKVKQQLLTYNQDVQGGWANITDPTNGVDFRITRAGERQGTTYVVSPLAQRSNVTQVLASQGYDLNNMQLFNLDELYPPRSYEDAQGLLEGRMRTPGFRPAPQAAAVSVEQSAPSPAQAPVAQNPAPVTPVAVPTAVDPSPAPLQQLTPTPAPATPEIAAPAPVQVPSEGTVTPPPMPPPPPTANETNQG